MCSDTTGLLCMSELMVFLIRETPQWQELPFEMAFNVQLAPDIHKDCVPLHELCAIMCCYLSMGTI